MKTRLVGLAFGCLMVGMAGVALADSYSAHTWIDEVGFTSDTGNFLQFDSDGDKATITFDISPPFTVGIDSVTSVQFFLDVLINGTDQARVLAGSWSQETGNLASGAGWDWTSEMTSNADILSSLNTSGELSFTIEWKAGDFKLTSARLAATGTGPNYSENVPTSPVPEPATMLLLGTGLAGLARARRKTQA